MKCGWAETSTWHLFEAVLGEGTRPVPPQKPCHTFKNVFINKPLRGGKSAWKFLVVVALADTVCIPGAVVGTLASDVISVLFKTSRAREGHTYEPEQLM